MWRSLQPPGNLRSMRASIGDSKPNLHRELGLRRITGEETNKTRAVGRVIVGNCRGLALDLANAPEAGLGQSCQES